MPKLSKEALEKRYPCEYCGKSFRNRAGLSGHIQFRHGMNHKKQLELNLTGKRLVDFSIWEDGFNLSQSTHESVFDMLRWWPWVHILCEIFELEVNQQDLKNYIITSLANISQNERLLQRLKTYIDGSLA